MKKLAEKFLSYINRADAYLGEKRMRRSPARNLHNILWERAAQQSADFVESHLGNCLIFESKTKMWDYTGQVVSEKYGDGLCLEFGVAGGTSVNWLSRLLPNFQFYGFDSFVGLKDDWKGHHATKGAYSQGGKMPKVNPNVQLIPGWFDETIPDFLQEHRNELSELKFVHIDGDTYEAAKAVFDEIGGILKPGVIVLFDELIGYPNWKNGEYKAFLEAQEKYNFAYEFLAFSSEQALVQIVPIS